MSVTGGINHAKQLNINRAQVLDSLRRMQCCSRAELSRLANLKRSTITNIIGELIDLGLVVETEILNGAGGHRSIGLRINGRRYQVIGVMVTRTFYGLIRIGLSGEVYEFKNLHIPADIGAEDLMMQIQRSIHDMIEGSREARIVGIGVAVPGPYRRKEGEVVFVTNLIGWDEFPISACLKKAFDIPVLLANDANAAAFAQYWYPSNKIKTETLAYIVAGQGIGCGLLSDGALIQGATGIAGEIGHTSIDYNGPRCECGNRGCLELYCSLLALENRIRKRIVQGESSSLSLDFTTEELAQAIQNRDPLAQQEFRRNCEYLAVGIVSLINQFDPGTIVIGDQLAQMEPELLLETVCAQLQDRLRPTIWEELNIQVDSMEYNSIAMGAAAIVADTILKEPFAYLSAKANPVG